MEWKKLIEDKEKNRGNSPIGLGKTDIHAFSASSSLILSNAIS